MDITPKDHLEAVALFRSEVVGALTRRDLARGELHRELVALSQQRLRPPRSKLARSFALSTLERWYYAYKAGGLEALKPQPRSDRGRGRQLTDEQRELICDIRREHPSVSVPLVLRTLRADRRIGPEVTACTVRRMLAERGLARTVDVAAAGGKARLRWQAERPGALCRGRLDHHQTGPAHAELHQMLQMPVAGGAVVRRILAHRRDGDPVGQRDGTQLKGGEEVRHDVDLGG